MMKISRGALAALAAAVAIPATVRRMRAMRVLRVMRSLLDWGRARAGCLCCRRGGCGDGRASGNLGRRGGWINMNGPA